MDKEEKQAIEYLKRHIIPVYGKKGQIEYFLNNIVLNLIEKQQKEIEELKDINKKLEARKYMYNAETGEVTAIPIDNNYISKDKIKAKVEKLEQNASYDEILTHIPRID